jgi:hypothetical protein
MCPVSTPQPPNANFDPHYFTFLGLSKVSSPLYPPRGGFQIKLAFLKLKWLVCGAEARTVEAPWNLLGRIGARFSPAEFNCFRHCGERYKDVKRALPAVERAVA